MATMRACKVTKKWRAIGLTSIEHIDLNMLKWGYTMSLFEQNITSSYVMRTHAIMAAQERRLTIRLRVLRELRSRNDIRLFDLHSRHEAFSERNAFYTIVALRRLRQETNGF
jgi:hypothetical protein